MEKTSFDPFACTLLDKDVVELPIWEGHATLKHCQRHNGPRVLSLKLENILLTKLNTYTSILDNLDVVD